MIRTLIMKRNPLRNICVALLVALSACRTDAVTSFSNDELAQPLIVHRGEELRIALGNVGPAQYESPPQISSSALTYLGVEVIPPFNPGGPTQQFTFRADRVGDVIISFRRILDGSVVSTTIATVEIR